MLLEGRCRRPGRCHGPQYQSDGLTFKESLLRRQHSDTFFGGCTVLTLFPPPLVVFCQPHNWPHVEDFQPSFQPAFQPAGSAELPASTQATETEMEVCPDDAAVSSDPSTTAGKPGAVAGEAATVGKRSLKD